MPDTRLRGKLLAIHGHRCEYCGCELNVLTMTIDHRRPRALAGSSGKPNLVPACERCNGKKAMRSEQEFRDWLQSADGIAWLAEAKGDDDA
jgi:5-methylcytosine-specific restriction endonuclease McrA